MTLRLWLSGMFGRPQANATINDVIRYYESSLMSRNEHLARAFRAREKNMPGTAFAEAVGFSLLGNVVDRVELYENSSTGGPDFVCRQNGETFLVEVTSISPESSACRSGISNQESTGGGWFSLITRQLVGAAKNKAPQVADQPMPRLVMIVSEHIASSGLLGPLAIETLLLGEYVGDDFAVEGKHQKTRMRDGAFIRYPNGAEASIPFRRSISGVLLVGVHHEELEARGLLHPDPVMPFDPKLLPSIPLAEVEVPVHFPDNPGKIRWLGVGCDGSRGSLRRYSQLGIRQGT